MSGPWRLPRFSPLGLNWSWFLAEARPWLDPDTDPWLVHPVDLRSSALPPTLPDGPAIYAVVGLNAWQYVGKTIRPVIERLRDHRHDSKAARRVAKIAAWEAVMATRLAPQTEASVISWLEGTGRDLLRPRMGERWGRRTAAP